MADHKYLRTFTFLFTLFISLAFLMSTHNKLRAEPSTTEPLNFKNLVGHYDPIKCVTYNNNDILLKNKNLQVTFDEATQTLLVLYENGSKKFSFDGINQGPQKTISRNHNTCCSFSHNTKATQNMIEKTARHQHNFLCIPGARTFLTKDHIKLYILNNHQIVLEYMGANYMDEVCTYQRRYENL